MDTLHKQIIDLENKIDGVHQIVERLSGQIATILLNTQQEGERGNKPLAGTSQMPEYSSHVSSNPNSVMEHKDVLLDGTSWSKTLENNHDKNLSPEIQIRRLTAQLTAAYNRIAALEEQLLASRIHS